MKLQTKLIAGAFALTGIGVAMAYALIRSINDNIFDDLAFDYAYDPTTTIQDEDFID